MHGARAAGEGAGATSTVAAFACTAAASPASHAATVAHALLDTVGSALAATGMDPDVLLRRYVMAQVGPGRSTVWATGDRIPAADAALLNGTLGHALDWDDVSPGSAMHPSVVLVPALLAVAEEEGSDGAALVSAYDVGAATFRAVAHALPRLEHYRRGWHTTSTVGRVAAVTALVRLLGLDEAAARRALGLVGSLAGGTLANFGTMTKPLHAGLAARDAVMACRLAAIGFTANSDHLEARAGFFDVYGEPAADLLAGLADDLERWRVRWPEDWGVKLYPACYATHRATDAALRLRSQHEGRLPRQVEVVVEPGGLLPLRPGEPATPMEAKFNMAYVLATAFVRGNVRMADFTDDTIADERVRALMSCVSAVEGASPPEGDKHWSDGFAVVTAQYDGGAVAHARVDHARGSIWSPLSEAEADAKFFEGCALGGLPDAASRGLAAALRSLPEAADLHAVGELLAAARANGKGTE